MISLVFLELTILASTRIIYQHQQEEHHHDDNAAQYAHQYYGLGESDGDGQQEGGHLSEAHFPAEGYNLHHKEEHIDYYVCIIYIKRYI